MRDSESRALETFNGNIRGQDDLIAVGVGVSVKTR